MSCSKLTMVVLTVLLLLLVFSLPSDACSCVGKWAPHRLCCRDIVLNGEVQGERLEGRNVTYEHENKLHVYRGKRVYSVKVTEIFKGLEKIKDISKDHNTSVVEIYTQPDGASCGIYLQLQRSYVISASVNRKDNIMESYLCVDWQSRSDKVPKSYQEFFPELNTCKCAANTNYAPGRLFFLVSILLTVVLNMN